jgi:hypothetical protein
MVMKRVILIGTVGVLLFFGFVVFVGSREPNPERDFVIAVATREAKARGWKRLKVEDARFQDGRWQVRIARLPRVVEGEKVFYISVETKISVFGGL